MEKKFMEDEKIFECNKKLYKFTGKEETTYRFLSHSLEQVKRVNTQNITQQQFEAH